MVPGSLSELQGHPDFPGDVWCQDPGCDYDVEDDVDLPEVQEALPDGRGEKTLLSLLLE